MSLSDVKELGNWFIGLIVAAGFAISHLKQEKREGDTGDTVEKAKQASAQVYIDQLAATIRRADEAATAAAAREADLRIINDQVRTQFAASIAEFRTTLAARDLDVGVLIESVAEWRGKAEALQAEKIDLQAAIQRQRTECNEEKRALTAAYERTIATLRTEMAGLEERNHALVNGMYGDGTATNIMGPLK